MVCEVSSPNCVEGAVIYTCRFSIAPTLDHYTRQPPLLIKRGSGLSPRLMLENLARLARTEDRLDPRPGNYNVVDFLALHFYER